MVWPRRWAPPAPNIEVKGDASETALRPSPSWLIEGVESRVRGTPKLQAAGARDASTKSATGVNRHPCIAGKPSVDGLPETG
ncbi:MAG: hypothetical protein Q8N05_18265 [Bacteroidota bacterium]|nr:hypothetical protein [Bacteroidota bacterium]